jgi:cell wall-associated NlpC family hydrolase
MIPLRKEASDRSEMVSQLLFGEVAEVLEESGSWIKVKLDYDAYVGWVDRKQMKPITENEFQVFRNAPGFVSTDLVSSLLLESGQTMQLVFGSNLPLFNQKKSGFADLMYVFEGNYIETGQGSGEKCLMYALQFLNAPYLWGGRSPFGIDCSGFTQIIMKLCGVALLRDANQQSGQGNMIHLFEESLAGDLAFFDNEESTIIHVGIILPDQQIIHASGKVRIDSLDHHGIYNHEQKKYTHKLRMIKRFF